jgi:Zn-dependent metalloprotease
VKPLKSHFCSIVSPLILKQIARNGSTSQQEAAWNTLTLSEYFRGQRSALTLFTSLASAATGQKRRTVYDAGHTQNLPGTLVRGEEGKTAKDRAVNEAFNAAGTFYDFLKAVFGRNSLDDKGLRLDSSVHFAKNYDNAFWNGQEIVYGDGDGELFKGFTKSLEVVGHELAHGLIQFEANFNYQGQSGALNESFSDVFGSLVKQFHLGQTVKEADWLIGADLLMESVQGRALRSLKDPGTAYDDPVLGRDPQPSHLRDYIHTVEDNGGVHLNSGIPNKAFYEVAARLGGKAWERAGVIWYQALTQHLDRDANFEDAAAATENSASDLYGSASRECEAVVEGWATVGVKGKAKTKTIGRKRIAVASVKKIKDDSIGIP